MLFNSLEFLLFFPAVTFTYYALPHKYRWALLLLASCVFYMFFIPRYIFILIFTIAVDYCAGLLIEKAVQPAKKKALLVLSICANVGILFFFKYFNFFNQDIRALAHFAGWNYTLQSLVIILPVGLSFHTLQAMSYTIEVYRGNQKAEKHLGIYALYVMYYPQLVAGPIERPQNMLHQFHKKHEFNYSNVANGLKLMLLGFFKKLVIADRLADYVDFVYKGPAHYHGLAILLAVVFFAFQIYCDFSGYSDIAIGASLVMGIRLMQNFDRPFISKSVTEFWRRWHISLYTWFNDYVFVPLVISLRNAGKIAVYVGLLITFFLAGLWHGAGWTFIIFGLLHGFALMYEFSTRKIRQRLSSSRIYDAASIIFTFGFACFSWIFFRASSFRQALVVIRSLFSRGQDSQDVIHYNFGLQQIAISTFAVAFLLALEYFQKNKGFISALNSLSRRKQWIICNLMFASIILLGIFAKKEFIYFQF